MIGLRENMCELDREINDKYVVGVKILYVQISLIKGKYVNFNM